MPEGSTASASCWTWNDRALQGPVRASRRGVRTHCSEHDLAVSTSSYSVLRNDSESRSAAANTAGACIRPGCLVKRSNGPDTEVAAMTLPLGERTGAETDATPC